MCKHHWIIETPAGPTSKGVCKFCQEERDLSNSLTGDEEKALAKISNKAKLKRYAGTLLLKV